MRKAEDRVEDAPQFPNGRFLGFEIWQRDPTPTWIKTMWFVSTVIGLLYMVFSVDIVLNVFGMDDSWDVRHGLVKTSSYPSSSLTDLVAIALDLPISEVHFIFSFSFGLYVLFAVADIAVGAPSASDAKSLFMRYPWPASWKTENTVCYHEMFSEPTRFGRLLRRPGNTLSNVTYLVSSLCVFASCSNTGFWMGDTLFALMLLTLAVFSTVWHASNAPWSQYVDIWAMDCCILYLIVRYFCLGGQSAFSRFGFIGHRISQELAGITTALFFGLLVFQLGKSHWSKYKSRWLHGRCPFSGRSRLLGLSDMGKCQVSTVCSFAALPVIYTGIPTLIQLCVIGSMGSTTAAIWVFRTLVVGWTYPLFDRRVLDGCILMKYFSDDNLPVLCRDVGAATVSPTAVLHFWTGLTLLMGYVHCRSVEEFVVSTNR